MWKLKVAEGNENPWLESLDNHIGRQHWEFDPEAGTPEERAEVERMRENFKRNRFVQKQSSDLLMRMQLTKENPSSSMPPTMKLEENQEVTKDTVTSTLRRAINYLSTIQAHDGHWPGDFGGPLFFVAPLVMALHVTGTLDEVLSQEHIKEIKRYMYNQQNEDGGWGLHVDGHSTMFVTSLNYIALRLLGEGPDGGEDQAVATGRQWILDHGGVTAIPSWGKFWLSVLGVYEWDGCNPMPPEFWLLPKIFPVNPGHLLCYCRLVYMPMSYIYGKQFVGSITELIKSLRNELYTQPYHEINWSKARNTFAKEDLYYPHPFVQDMFWGFLRYFAEPLIKYWPFSKLRQKAIKRAMEHIHYEDENTRYFTIGSVEKSLCLIACWVDDPNSTAFKKHLARIPDYLWLAEDGMKMQGFGSQTWDASFAVQAIFASGLTYEYATTLKKAHDFLQAAQVKENPSGNFNKMYRHFSKGGWTLSIRDQGWLVSDCTAEAFKCVLLLSQMPSDLVGEKIDVQHLYDAVNVILYLQSKNGGFSVWEPRQAYDWVEKFNPTEFFEDCFTEKDYVECTSSAIQSLVLFKKLYPEHRRKEIEICISKGLNFIENAQRPDGSWYGKWGICFTYAAWFAVEAFTACGRNFKNSVALRKACGFLLSKQLPDGGWGESHISCSSKVYTNLGGNRSNLVQTSWALLALIHAGQWDVNPTPIERGIQLLINSQANNGDYPEQENTGIYFRNCTLTFSLYRNVFPIRALGEYRRLCLHA